MMITRKQSTLAKLAVVTLILLTMVVYMPPFIRSFVGDDYIQFDYVKSFVQNPATILGVFNPAKVPWYYRPTQNLWFWLNRLILEHEPFGYYIILLWLHALVIALMVRVGRQFRLGLFAAICTAVLFAIHSHWVDVVTWISSVAIVMSAIFSLLALSALLSYLSRPSSRQLLIVLVLTSLTFLTHEEALLLVPFLLLLLVVWRWQNQRLESGDQRLKKRKRKRGRQSQVSNLKSQILNLKSLISKQELLTFALLFLLMGAYVILQFTRPNPTVQVSERTLAEWLPYFSWPEISQFILVTAYRFSFSFSILDLSGFTANLFITGLLIILVVWFWQGNWVVRLGLVWLLLHLFFIYGALWTQLPSLYAGRHIYQAGIGLALAIGATIQQLVRAGAWRFTIGNKRINLQSPIPNLIMLTLLALLAWYHVSEVRLTQQVWLKNVAEEEAAKAQLFEQFPEITEDTHIFSIRFPILPDFTRSVAQLWYDVPLERPGGGLAHLRAYGRATSDFIVLDYEDSQVYNLMPELQAHDETIFLWAQSENDIEMRVVKGSNGNQLAERQTPVPGQWTGNLYRVTVPENSELHTAVLAQPGISYRLRLGTSTADAVPIFEQAPLAENSSPEWIDVTIPLSASAGRPIGVWLETTANGETEQSAYWANLRFVIDH